MSIDNAIQRESGVTWTDLGRYQTIAHVLITADTVKGSSPPGYWKRGEGVLFWETWAKEERAYKASMSWGYLEVLPVSVYLDFQLNVKECNDRRLVVIYLFHYRLYRGKTGKAEGMCDGYMNFTALRIVPDCNLWNGWYELLRRVGMAERFW